MINFLEGLVAGMDAKPIPSNATHDFLVGHAQGVTFGLKIYRLRKAAL